MSIGNNGGDTVRQRCPREKGRGDHGAFDVHMDVDQSGDHILSGRIHGFFRLQRLQVFSADIIEFFTRDGDIFSFESLQETVEDGRVFDD